MAGGLPGYLGYQLQNFVLSPAERPSGAGGAVAAAAGRGAGEGDIFQYSVMAIVVQNHMYSYKQRRTLRCASRREGCGGRGR